SGSSFDSWMALATILCVGFVAVFTRGMLQRLLILIGLLLAYVLYAVLTNGMGLGKPIDFSTVANAAWFGLPHFAAPVFQGSA
ncbi:solute carrier family 23 protein, partial [Acinetobacter baumannii]